MQSNFKSINLKKNFMSANKACETIKLSFDWYKIDKEKEIQSLKSQYKSDINDMSKEMKLLQNKLEGNLI